MIFTVKGLTYEAPPDCEGSFTYIHVIILAHVRRKSKTVIDFVSRALYGSAPVAAESSAR